MHIIALTTSQIIMTFFTLLCMLALAALAGYAIGEVRGGLTAQRAARNLARGNR